MISTKTLDLDHLKQLKRGTLGREYVEWLGRGHLTPDGRDEVR
jgi:ubiquinone biosynthesis protein COQ4